MDLKYKNILQKVRIQPSKIKDRTIVEEMASDRSRIIYSSSFRRLQRKAQVFPLEDNSAVRSRLTHSLEVSDVGRLISQHIVYKHNLVKDPELKTAFIYAVENACLLHDIGNPPFGHFGEKAIQKWFENNWEGNFSLAINNPAQKIVEFRKNYLPDFEKFDGNPQGLRIATRLQRDRDKNGMNLTFTTLLSFIKYVSSTLNVNGEGLTKKPGFFISEIDIVEKAKKTLNIKAKLRFPLAYIMEAADDISYCISDIEDGIEKGIIATKDFFQALFKEWKKYHAKIKFPGTEKINMKRLDNLDMFMFKTRFTRNLAKRAAKKYYTNHDEILKGEIVSLFNPKEIEGKAMRCLKTVAKQKLFRSREAENPELAGHRIIYGILEILAPLLQCKRNDFNKLVRKHFDGLDEKNDLNIRLVNRLPKKHIKTYLDHIKENKPNDIMEWFYRAHLITDFIAGMTDNFALETYQLLHGIRIK